MSSASLSPAAAEPEGAHLRARVLGGAGDVAGMHSLTLTETISAIRVVADAAGEVDRPRRQT